MLKIEFDAGNKELAAALGTSLLQYGAGEVVAQGTAALFAETQDAECVELHEDDSPEDDSPAPDLSKRPVDERGVPHHPELCVGLKSDKPFYATGPTTGQWKKGRGVDQDAYDKWYAVELAKAAPYEEPDAEQNVDSSGAFGSRQTEPDPAPEQAGPVTAGDFMSWISELTVAGKLDPQRTSELYQRANVQMQDLFNQQTEREAVAKLVPAVNQMIGG